MNVKKCFSLIPNPHPLTPKRRKYTNKKHKPIHPITATKPVAVLA